MASTTDRGLLKKMVVSNKKLKKVPILLLKDEINEVLDAGFSVQHLYDELMAQKKINCKYNWFRIVIKELRDEGTDQLKSDLLERPVTQQKSKSTANPQPSATTTPTPKKGASVRGKRTVTNNKFRHHPAANKDDLI